MSNIDLFAKALNIQAPWYIKSIEFKKTNDINELHIYLDFVKGSNFTVKFDNVIFSSQAYDTIDKTWRHLNFFQYKTYIHARTPRVKSEDGKKICIVDVPWARKNSAFTLLFETFFVELAQNMPISAASKIVDEHDTRMWRIIIHYTNEARKLENHEHVTAIGMDETSIKGHHYVTVCADIEEKKVLFVTEGKDKDTVSKFVNDFIEHNGKTENIEVVTSDMSLGFLGAIKEKFKNAVSVIDKFHVIKHFNDAVDNVRRAEVKDKPILKGSRYCWLKNQDKLTKNQKKLFESLSKKRLKTGRAYTMKTTMQEIYAKAETREEAETAIDKLCQWMKRSRLDPMKEVAETVINHKEEILNYWDHNVTNATLEGINSIIQNIKCRARGFRNIEYFKSMIYLVAGRLHLDKVLAKF